LFHSCYGDNSIKIGANVYQFPVRVYNGIKRIAHTIMNPNCHSSKITVDLKEKRDFAIRKPLYVYTYSIERILFGDLRATNNFVVIPMGISY